jgi:hypothetical protein
MTPVRVRPSAGDLSLARTRGYQVEQLSLYVDEQVARRGRGVKRLPVYLGLAVLLAAASLVAVHSRDGTPSKFPRVIMPGQGSACNGTPGNGFLFTGTADGVTLQVCISQEGNINQIRYPTTGSGDTNIAFDGYCLLDLGDESLYRDFSPGAPVGSTNFGPATFTQTAPEIFSVTRDTTDGRYRLTQFIKVNIQPRSVFVGMTVRNLSSAARMVALSRWVAPAVSGSSADDIYNGFGGNTNARAGIAYHNPGIGNEALLFGATQASGDVFTSSYADFQEFGGCNGNPEDPGSVQVPPRVFFAFTDATSISPGQSVTLGKFVYRMA